MILCFLFLYIKTTIASKNDVKIDIYIIMNRALFIIMMNNFLIFIFWIANPQIFIIKLIFYLFFQSCNSNQYKLNINLYVNIF